MSELTEARLARAYLLAVAEPPAPALVALIAEVGPVDAARLVRAGNVPAPVSAETSARRNLEVTPEDLARLGAHGMRLAIPEDAEWPAWPLLSLEVAAGRGVRGMVTPVGLWVRGSGRLDEVAERSVTLVGARASTPYGDYAAADWAYSLAGQGVTVVSGAAYGIDASAHRGALAAEGATVAVLGCALDAGYPSGHDTLLARIADSGLVISEYPPGTPPAKHRFLVRNRLLAALTAGTVVVEADVRSGARNTARLAQTLGKAVMAVPGPITARSSAGCHEMIRAGHATLVTSAEQVLEAVGRMGSDLVTGERPRPPQRQTDRLKGEALRVHDALRVRAGRSPERVSQDSGVPIEKVRALLQVLELEGFAVRFEAGWRRAAASKEDGK